MNLNNVYLPHFCRPCYSCYHKKSLMDLIMFLIAHFVLMISFVNGFVIRNSFNSSDAQQIPTHHQTIVMPIKSVTYELTVVHDPLSNFNKTRTKTNQKTNLEHTKTHQPTKVNQLDQLDKLNQEKIDQLNQVQYLNGLNKVNINPFNIIENSNNQQITQQTNQINESFDTKGHQNKVTEDVKGQKNQINESYGVKNQQNQINEPFDVNSQQSQINDNFNDLKGIHTTNQETIQEPIKQNEVRDGFVVLTSAHNSMYPGPMSSRNVLSQIGSTIQNDFYQKYYTSTTTVTIRPILKEHHEQIEQEQIYEKVNEKSQIKGYQNLVNSNFADFNLSNSNLNNNDSLFSSTGTFSPEDKPEKDTELNVASDSNKPNLINEFNSIQDEGSGKSFFELFGDGITSYNLHKNNSSSPNSNYLMNTYNQTMFNDLGSTTTNAPIFDLTAEDSNYRPFLSSDQNRLKAHGSSGTRPGQPLTTYELFKEYPLINNSNIIINQFHSTPNWTKPENTNKNQSKPFLNIPTEFSFVDSFLANYSTPINQPAFRRPIIITEFANEFLTNLTSSNYDLDKSDSSDSILFFNQTTSTTTTQSPIGTLDKNQFDIPISSIWNSVADQLISAPSYSISTTLSPLSSFHSLPSTHHHQTSTYNTSSSPLPIIHVSASDLVTLKRNHSNSQKFPFKNNYFHRKNNTLNLSSSNNVPQHFHALPVSVTPASVLYSATQNSINSQLNNHFSSVNSSTSSAYFIPFTSTSTSTPSTITPEVYQFIPGIATRQPPLANLADHNYTTLTNNHNFDESIHYNNPLRLATNPKLIQPLTFLVMSYLASKSSIGANLITRNDQPLNSTASASNGGLVDWLRFTGRRNRKRKTPSTRSNKQASRQQKQRNTNSNNNNKKISVANTLPLALSSLQIRPITLDDILLNQLAGASSLTQQAFPTSLSPLGNPFIFQSTRAPSLTSTTGRLPQMIFETKRNRPSSSYIPEDYLSDGFTADDYEEEIRSLLENPLSDLRLNSKLLNNDNVKQTNKNSGSSSTYRTHRNSQSQSNSRNSRTPPDSSGSNINTPTSHSLESDLNGHSTNTPAPRCDKFTNHICIDDFEYPESAILEEIDRKRQFFQLLYSEVKGDVPQVDGLTRLQEQALTWDNQFGSNNQLNDSSNESSFSSSNNLPNRNSYLTIDDDILNNDKTSFRFSSLVKDQTHGSKTSGFICSSEILYGRPKLAKNVKGQWKVIVNAGQYTQTVRMEKCLQPNKACSFVQSAATAIGATSRCAQVNAFHRLIAFEKGKGFYIETFKIPSSCACYVQHKNKVSSSAEFDSEEIGSNHYKKINRKRIDRNQPTTNKAEIDRQTSNRLQPQQGISLPTSIFNQPFILNDLNSLQRSKLQALFPTFGQRVSTLNNANSLINTKLQKPAIELRPLYLKNGGTLLASLLPLVNNDKANNLNSSNLIEKLSISGNLNPALLEQQQRELNQLILDLIRLNAITHKTAAERSKIINLEDLIRSQLSLAQVTPNHLLEQLNNAFFASNRIDLTNAKRRKNSSPSNNLFNGNQKIGLLYLDDGSNDKSSKTNLKALPVVKLVHVPRLNNQLVYGQRFVDKRKSGLAHLLMANQGNYSNILNNNLLNKNLLNGNNNLLSKTPLIIQRDNAFNLETPISALKIINPENLMTQSPVQPSETDPKDEDKETDKESAEDSDEDDEKVVDEIDVGNLLGKFYTNVNQKNYKT